MRSLPTYIAWLSLAVALLSVGALGYFIQQIGNEEAAYNSAQQSMQEQAMRDAARTRATALVHDTTLQRASLEHYLSTGVLEIAQTIRGAGKDAGVSVALSGALPGTPPQAQPASGPPLHAIGFVVQAKGSFAALMHLEHLFETLPLASSVERFDLSRTPAGNTQHISWQMSAHIRVLTTSPISS